MLWFELELQIKGSCILNCLGQGKLQVALALASHICPEARIVEELSPWLSQIQERAIIHVVKMLACVICVYSTLLRSNWKWLSVLNFFKHLSTLEMHKVYCVQGKYIRRIFIFRNIISTPSTSLFLMTVLKNPWCFLTIYIKNSLIYLQKNNWKPVFIFVRFEK